MFLNEIKKEKPRYFKDQLSLLREISEHPTWGEYRYAALEYCIKYQQYSAVHFKSAAQYYNEINQIPKSDAKKPLLTKKYMDIHPKVRDIREYIAAMEG